MGEGFLPSLNKLRIIHTFFEGTAKLSPLDFVYDDLLTPMTNPVFMSIRGPPEFPLLIAVSVWITSLPLKNLYLETMPLEAENDKSLGWPKAAT